MKLNQNIQALENFFASNAVKNIFDNIRNLVLSTVVLIAGNFLLPDDNSLAVLLEWENIGTPYT